MSPLTKDTPKLDGRDQVADLDTEYYWPDRMVGTARQRMRGAAVRGTTDQFAAYYVTFARQPAPSEGAGPADPAGTSGPAEKAAEKAAAPAAAEVAGSSPPANRPLPDSVPPAPVYTTPRHPLAYEAATLDLLQDALDVRSPGRFVASDPAASFATLTTGTHGAPRAWGRNVLDGPRLLSQVAGVPSQPVAAVFAQFPQLTLPTASPLVAEGVPLVEYASSAAGSVTLGRFGRFTDMSKESLIGADAAAVTGMHRVGIALDLDKVLIDAVSAAAGAAAAFTADVPAAIRKAMAQVLASTAAEDPSALVIVAHPDDANLLQDVAPTGGDTVGEKFQRFSGALVYPSNSATAGFMVVANLMVGARYFTAQPLTTLTDVDVKTGVETSATFIIAGYGVTLTAGFARKVDVVTP